jgi:catechol 2,3-dioxygenase-like lactoylglutathione lyase family enzyme
LRARAARRRLALFALCPAELAKLPRTCWASTLTGSAPGARRAFAFAAAPAPAPPACRFAWPPPPSSFSSDPTSTPVRASTVAARAATATGMLRRDSIEATLWHPRSPYDQEPHMTSVTSPITGVDFVTVFVKDFAAAREFYGSVLGLPCSADYGRVPGAEYETGSLTLQLMDAEAIGREFHPSTHPIALHVEDVEAARAELESRGVSFVADTMDSGVCHMAFFADPDGNALMIHHRYAPKA